MEDYTFQFVDYRLVKLNYSLNCEVTEGESIDINPSLSINREIDKKQLKLFIEVKMDNADMPFNLHVVIGGLFEFTRNVEDIKIIEKIANINCAAILFPFLREVVADVTRRSGLPPLLLPPVNFCKIHDELTKARGIDAGKS